MEIGTICKIHGLALAPHLNGQYVEILKGLALVEVPEPDGIKRVAERYGAEVITAPAADTIGPISGYFKPENLEELPGATRRAMDLHLFGWTNDN